VNTAIKPTLVSVMRVAGVCMIIILLLYVGSAAHQGIRLQVPWFVIDPFLLYFVFWVAVEWLLYKN